jgi:hypothetical protein
MAHDILEGIGKFIHNCVPYIFVSFVPSISEVSADDFDLVVDPVSNFRSSYEGEEQHCLFQWHGHNPSLIIECPINVPFCEEVFNFGSVSVEDFGFSPY